MVVYPWAFQDGSDTARDTTYQVVGELGRRASYASVSASTGRKMWEAKGYPAPSMTSRPSRRTLAAYGNAMNAAAIMYGTVSWHTRSIWVNAGPKTISTATVNVYVYDVKNGRVSFSRKGIEGRSDEKSNGYKIAASLLFTPLVTAVSGGPKTPQEIRAVQIALSLAYNDWIVARTRN
jgi:hypothetical protein